MPDFSSVERLDLSGKRVVVSGGTQGIGAGIARFADHLGATVVIIGRSATRGHELIRNFSVSDGEPPRDHLFISADLETVHGTKVAAQRVNDWAGEENVDFLFQTQGGTPSETETLTKDALDSHFAVQALSRFVLPYTLAELGVLQDSTVLMVAAAGEAGDTIDFNNLDAKGLSTIAKMHNSTAVLDVVTKEFEKRYTSFRVLHTHPGFVSTNVAVSSYSAWYLRLLLTPVLSIPYMNRTPDQYARIAMWLATSEQVKRRKDIVSWTQRGTEARLSAVARDEKLSARVWQKLVSLVDDV